MKFHLFPLGDCALTIEFAPVISHDIHQMIQSISSFLDNHPPKWLIEYVPAFTTITLFYNPVTISRLDHTNTLPYDYVCKQVNELLSPIEAKESTHARTIHLPVCYGGPFGPDLEIVAKINHLTIDEVIRIHTSAEYLVYMLGFAPGFPYLGGMSDKIATSRKETPRLSIPERSVGIAGQQTGIYPIETPGGWQIIGRTPLTLFRPNENPPSLLKAGDKVRFQSISHQEYVEWEEKE